MPDTANSDRRRIGLALSGGGFRATLFHMGVVRCLRDYGLLQHVTTLTAVSGGSVLAAHLALHWSHWTSDKSKDFQKVWDEVLALTQIDLRNRIVRRLPLAWLYGFFSPIRDGTSTSLLAHFYDRDLYKKGRLEDFAADTHLLTTNLTIPEADTYFARDGFHLRRPGDPLRKEPSEVVQHVECTSVPVAAAVAASSAFPILFKPVRANGRFLNCTIRDTQPLPQFLSDGGVNDNLGSYHLARTDSGDPLDEIILSDAGAEIEWLETNYGRSTLKTLARCFDVSQAVRPAAIYNNRPPVIISIHDFKPSEGHRLTADQLKQVGKIRTDFDEFSSFEQWCLINHGYSVASKKLKTCRQAGQAVIFQSWNETGVKVPTDISRALRQSSRRLSGPWRLLKVLFDVRDWRAFIGWIVVLCALAYGGYNWVPKAAHMARAAFIWVADRALPIPDTATIRFQERRPAAGTIPFKHSFGILAVDTLDYARRGLQTEAGGQQQLRIYEQSQELFRSRPSRLNLIFESDIGEPVNVRARDGKAFLVSPGPSVNAIGVREIPLPKQSDGSLVGHLELPRVCDGEVLVFLLVVEPKVPGEQLDPSFQLRIK